MNLQEILEKATVKPDELEKVNGEWTHIDRKTGKVITEKFNFFVLKEITFSSHMTLMRALLKNERESAALTISERCRFGENGEERMTYEQAETLDPLFGEAILKAMVDLGKSQQKKPLRQRMKSGTSSSSAASGAARSRKRKTT